MNITFDWIPVLILWIPGTISILIGLWKNHKKAKFQERARNGEAWIMDITFYNDSIHFREDPKYRVDIFYLLEDQEYNTSITLLPDEITNYKKGDPIPIEYAEDDPYTVRYLHSHISFGGGPFFFFGFFCFILPFLIFFT